MEYIGFLLLFVMFCAGGYCFVRMAAMAVNQWVEDNDRIQGLAILQQPIWVNQESEFERLNFGKPRW